MSNVRPLYCWDTSVVIGLLKAEQDKPLDQMRAIAKDVDDDKADMVVSITTTVEFDDIIDDAVLRDEYSAFLERPNVLLVNVSPPVAKRACLLRRRAREGSPSRKIKTGDAQVVATAILHRADVLHTTDDKLCSLSESGIVDGLKICWPILKSGQLILPLTQIAVAEKTAESNLSHLHRNGHVQIFGRQLTAIERAVLPKLLTTFGE